MTFGRVLRTMQVGDFVLMETIHPPGLRLARHEHRDASLNLVLTGSFVETFARRSYSCDPLTVFYKPQGESHSNRYSQATSRSVLVAFQSPAISRLRAFTSDLDRLWCVRGGAAAVAMRELCGELYFPDQATPLIVEGCIWRVLGHAGRQSQGARIAGRPCWLGRVEELIRESPSEQMTLTEIAAGCGVHPAHLNKVFRRHFGLSIGRYLRHLKVEHAKQLLTNSALPLAQVAAESGFYDQSHFARVFRRAMGCAPSHFRREMCAVRPQMRKSSKT
jgi:AraC family transcriptional regulator